MPAGRSVFRHFSIMWHEENNFLEGFTSILEMLGLWVYFNFKMVGDLFELSLFKKVGSLVLLLLSTSIVSSVTNVNCRVMSMSMINISNQRLLWASSWMDVISIDRCRKRSRIMVMMISFFNYIKIPLFPNLYKLFMQMTKCLHN